MKTWTRVRADDVRIRYGRGGRGDGPHNGGRWGAVRSRALVGRRANGVLALVLMTLAGVTTVGLAPASQAAAASVGISAPPDVVVGAADGSVTLPVTLNAPTVGHGHRQLCDRRRDGDRWQRVLRGLHLGL